MFNFILFSYLIVISVMLRLKNKTPTSRQSKLTEFRGVLWIKFSLNYLYKSPVWILRLFSTLFYSTFFSGREDIFTSRFYFYPTPGPTELGVTFWFNNMYVCARVSIFYSTRIHITLFPLFNNSSKTQHYFITLLFLSKQ